MSPKVAFLMANYGHDPTETAIPYTEFKKAGFEIDFVTEKGNMPECDAKMLTGMTQKLLGATKDAVDQYNAMKEDMKTIKAKAWTDEGFTLEPYDLVFLPGGHEKGVVQVINSPVTHRLMVDYFPKTRKPSKKNVSAICHGVMVLSESSLPNGKSVLHDATTTALPGFMEQGIFWATRAFLGDYYKTYGAGSDSVQTSVEKRLDDPSKQYFNSLGSSPFIREDETYNYISGRFPPDAALLAEKTITLVQKSVGS
ncbi:hypothetical protein OEA41_002741 [Lepraria neglecta]|uniref:Class I glutamine amidotransferase-like protein n=1 Tax=Lepraria neglecta TaxID=209136 RepID=A0AAD9Z3B4_9LECA|nr:hypothetical protein OEA41_002741 [Lepraria neglecta]